MKSFENLRYQTTIESLERRLLEKTQENQALKQAKSLSFIEVSKEKPAKLQKTLQKLLKENHQLVNSMQNALDSCPSAEIFLRNSRDCCENSRKTEVFLKEIAELQSQVSCKDSVIAELREKLLKTEQKHAEIELKLQVFKETEARFREEARGFSEKPAKNKELCEIEEKNAQLLREIAVERGLREEYFTSIKELEKILRELMNEGEFFRNSVKKTVSEESRRVIEKYRLVFEEKPQENQ